MKYLVVPVLLLTVACAPAFSPGPPRALQIVHNRYGHESARLVAIDDRHVYILDGSNDSFGLRRVPRGGGPTETITRGNESGSWPTAIALDDTHLYFMVHVGEVSFRSDAKPQTRVFRAEKTVEPRLEALATVDGAPGDLVLLGGDIIFSTTEQSPAIHRMSKQGQSRSAIVELAAESAPVDLLAHGNTLIVADHDRGIVFELSLAGETRELVKIEGPVEVAAHGDRLAVVTARGVFEVPSGKQLARGSRDATFKALAAAPEGLYYRHEQQLRFLPWTGGKATILQKARFDIDDVIVADEGLYYIDSNEVWFRARARARS
ncbi:MAG: hypothetical protein K8M05_30945 [Deltaproteobacteria bacterium]|nr:hypothetical protein [Kofleriaceae bacterium]